MKLLGRYVLCHQLASGGMATVHLGRLVGPAGFGRTVAIKRLHAHYAKDPFFVEMFLNEARLAARIRHPNVAPVLDVVPLHGELFLVMDYVHGEAVSTLLRAALAKQEGVPVPITVRILIGVLEGLHAAHELRDEHGAPLNVVHRDISPQNILLGADGAVRVVDFGVAKAANHANVSVIGTVKGKLGYMAPEQVRGERVTCRTDIFAVGLVAWELLTGKRLRPKGVHITEAVTNIHRPAPPLSMLVDHVPESVMDAVQRALSIDPTDRFSSALDFAKALSSSMPLPPAWEIAHWVQSMVGHALQPRERLVAEMERISSSFAVTANAAMVEPGTSGSEPSYPPVDSMVYLRSARSDQSSGAERMSPPALPQECNDMLRSMPLQTVSLAPSLPLNDEDDDATATLVDFKAKPFEGSVFSVKLHRWPMVLLATLGRFFLIFALLSGVAALVPSPSSSPLPTEPSNVEKVVSVAETVTAREEAQPKEVEPEHRQPTTEVNARSDPPAPTIAAAVKSDKESKRSWSPPTKARSGNSPHQERRKLFRGCQSLKAVDALQ